MAPAGSGTRESERSAPDVAHEQGADMPAAGRPTADHPRWSASRWLPGLVVTLIAACAALVRLPGVLWGLPASLHPDEWVITHGAIEMAANNSFEPPYFDRPDHLEMQISTLLYRAFSQIVYGAPAENMFEHHPGTFLGLSRLVTVAFGVVAVYLAYGVARRFGVVSGLVAAFLVAFFSPFVENGSYATPDMPLTTILLGVILLAMRYIEAPRWGNLVGGCALVALAVTVKYPGALGAVPIGIAILTVALRTRRWGRAVLHTLAAPVVFVAGIFAFSPVLITNFTEVKHQLFAQNGENGHLGADGLSWGGNFTYYFDSLAPALGTILMVATLVGIGWCIRDRAFVALPLAFGLVFWVAISALALHWARWGLPIMITPLVLAAVGVGRTATWLATRRRAGRRHARAAIVVASVLAGVAGVAVLSGGASAAAKFAATDTRIEALSTFKELGITADNAVMDGYTPLFPQAPDTVANHLSLENGQFVSDEKPDAKYAIVSSGMYPRYLANPKYAKEQAVYRALEKLPVVARWDPENAGARSVEEPISILHSLEYVADVAEGGLSGPTIIVYQLP